MLYQNSYPHSFSQEKEQMVQTQIEARGIHDPRVLKALRIVPRHFFVPPHLKNQSYQDSALPIGYQQTISQPYIVAFMTAAADIKPTDRILEIGTGSGYQAAVLSQVCQEVFTIEIIEPLAKQAEETLNELGYTNTHIKVGDGHKGWLEAAPFDVILITAVSSEIPKPLLNQLSMGGRLIMPIRKNFSEQRLIKITKTKEGVIKEELISVWFVPMTRQRE
jgi:protein-L-isoaspartate(D-aspartate) O-methyltransferase